MPNQRLSNTPLPHRVHVMGQIVYKHADNFDSWCDEMNEMGYDVVEYDGGIYERLMNTPHGTEVWCYPHWQLVKREVIA
jgi:hypothetical protein